MLLPVLPKLSRVSLGVQVVISHLLMFFITGRLNEGDLLLRGVS
jgi:hypothetical protein